MTRRRTLRPEEEELWQRIAQSATPLHKKAEPLPTQPKTPPPEPVQEFKLPAQTVKHGKGSTAFDLAPDVSDQVRSAPLRMDSKNFKRMKQGRLVPEGKIDLHGMTQDRAHAALTQFILWSQSQNKRLVLVITGKGKTDRGHDLIPVRHGVLRHQVPQWLTVPPLAQAVLQVTQAHQKHGGGGAYYVYLRRNR